MVIVRPGKINTVPNEKNNGCPAGSPLSFCQEAELTLATLPSSGFLSLQPGLNDGIDQNVNLC